MNVKRHELGNYYTLNANPKQEFDVFMLFITDDSIKYVH